MRLRRLVLTVSAAALAQPSGAADAEMLLVPGCGSAAHLIIVPRDPSVPKRGRDCAKACHAVSDRREKLVKKKGCCC